MEPLMKSHDVPTAPSQPRAYFRTLFAALVLAFAPSALAQATHIVANPATVDFGDVPPGVAVTRTVSLENVGNFPLHVRSLRPSCECTVAKLPRDTEILPGESLALDMTFTGTEREGPTTPSLMVLFAEQIPPLRIDASANVNRGIRFSVEEAHDPQGAPIPVARLESVHDRPFRILSVNGRTPVTPMGATSASEAAPAHLVGIAPAPAGAVAFPGESRWVAIETDDPDAPVVVVPAPGADLDSERRSWTVSERLLVLGPLAHAEDSTFTVLLTGARGEPLNAIEALHMDTHGVDGGLLGVEAAPSGMNARLFVRPLRQSGVIAATFNITVNGHTETLDVYGAVPDAVSGQP